MKEQTIFKRYEVKYRITLDQKERLLQVMEEYMRADHHGESTILSLYFDTPDHLLIRRSMEHPEYKEKIRLRSYGVPEPDTEIFLELKKKYRKVVYKRRLALPEEAALKILDQNGTPPETTAMRSMNPGPGSYQDRQTLRELGEASRRYLGLAPQMMICYDREAWYGKDDHDLRITFDRNIRWRDHSLRLTLGDMGKQILPEDQILMEIKTGTAIPLWLTDFLSKERIYKTTFSKYAHAYEAMLQRGHGPEKVRARLIAAATAAAISAGRREQNYEYTFSRAL